MLVTHRTGAHLGTDAADERVSASYCIPSARCAPGARPLPLAWIRPFPLVHCTCRRTGGGTMSGQPPTPLSPTPRTCELTCCLSKARRALNTSATTGGRPPSPCVMHCRSAATPHALRATRCAEEAHVHARTDAAEAPRHTCPLLTAHLAPRLPRIRLTSWLAPRLPQQDACCPHPDRPSAAQDSGRGALAQTTASGTRLCG